LGNEKSNPGKVDIRREANRQVFVRVVVQDNALRQMNVGQVTRRQDGTYFGVILAAVKVKAVWSKVLDAPCS